MKVEDIIEHVFLEELYLRKAKLAAGTRIRMHRHQYEHMGVLAKGTVEVIADGVQKTLSAPAFHLVPAGEEHGVLAKTDVLWYCTHVTDESSVDDIDAALVQEGELHAVRT